MSATPVVRSLTANTLINIAGQSIPIVFALFAIPSIIAGIGTDRFGILSIAWLVIGYFSLFDLGLGRALTQVVAQRRAETSSKTLAGMVWTVLVLMLITGMVGGIVVAVLSPWLASTLFKLPELLQLETAQTFLLLAAGIPLVVVSAGLAGLLAAFDRFDLINAVRTPLGITNFAAPLVIIPFSNSLVHITTALVLCRLIATVAQLWLCLRVMPSMRTSSRLTVVELPMLFRFGGWMTVTNIVGPMMVYFDRFLIGAIISVAAVAYYATPYEIVTKLLIFPAAVAATLFPRFASTHKIEPKATVQLLIRGWESVLLLLFPVLLLVIVLAREGLALWLNIEFANNGSSVLQWLSIGIMLNALAQMPFALIQGVGRPDLSAKAHLLELIVYVPLLWWALDIGGIEGAAIAWTLRAAFDCFLLSLIAVRLAPGFGCYLRRTLPYLAAVIVALVTITQAAALQTRFALGGLALVLGALLLSRLDILPYIKNFAVNKLNRA